MGYVRESCNKVFRRPAGADAPVQAMDPRQALMQAVIDENRKAKQRAAEPAGFSFGLGGD